MKNTDPSLNELLGSLHSLFEAEVGGIVQESRTIEAKLDHSRAGQDAAKAQLDRLEGLLAELVAGQAALHARLDALERRQADPGRLEDLVLRLLARLPLAAAGQPLTHAADPE